MRQPEPNRDSVAFLSALADELSTPPDDLTTWRQVEAAASAARTARSISRSHVTRWAAAVLAVTTLFGTGGIAVAGGLPAPLQAVVADVARALPVPFHVPYPKPSAPTVTAGVGTVPGRVPEDAEVEVAPYEVADTSVPAVPAPEISVNESDVGGLDVDSNRDKDGDPARCDLEELPGDRDQLDADEVRELRDQIRQVCGFDLVDPPGWAEGLVTDDQERDDREDRRDEEGDFGSSESEDSDGTSESENHEEEKRHDDEDEDEDEGNDRSSDDEWRDGHD